MAVGGGANARAKYDLSAEDKTKGALKSAKKGFAGVSASISALGATGVAVLGAGGLGLVVTKFATASARSLDELAKASKRVGTTVEDLDALTFATELAGGSAADLETAWKRAARNLLDAKDGIGDGKKALDSLGLSATDGEGRLKSVQTLILEMADELPNFATETEKVAVAQQLFGRAGTTLLPLLRQGREAIHAQLVEAHTLGIRTSALASAGEELMDSQLRLNRAWRTGKDIVAGALLPTLSSLADTMASKLVGLISGLDQEMREFLGNVALEAPAVQIELLNKQLADTEALMAPIQAESERFTAELDLAANAGRDLNGVTLRGLKDNNKELKPLKKFQEEIRQALDAAAEAMERQAKTEARIRAGREIVAKRELEIMTATGKQEESKIRQQILDERSVEAVRESRDLLMEMSMPEFDIEWLPKPDEFLLTLDRYSQLADIVGGIGDTISGELGNEMAEFIRTGTAGADAFGRAWRKAMAQLLGDLTAAIAKATLLSAINSFGGFGFSGGLSSLFGGGGPAPVPVEKMSGTTVFYNNSSLLPGLTEDFLRVEIQIQEANNRSDRYAIAGSG